MYVVGDERWNVMGVCAVCRPGIFRAWGLSLRARMYVCMRYIGRSKTDPSDSGSGVYTGELIVKTPNTKRFRRTA